MSSLLQEPLERGAKNCEVNQKNRLIVIQNYSPWCRHQEDHLKHWSRDLCLPPWQVLSLVLQQVCISLWQHLQVRLVIRANPKIGWSNWKVFRCQKSLELLPTWKQKNVRESERCEMITATHFFLFPVTKVIAFEVAMLNVLFMWRSWCGGEQWECCFRFWSKALGFLTNGER